MSVTLILAFFKRKRRPPPAAPAWPSALNPCRRPGEHSRATYWDVGGHTTRCCSECVWEKEKELGDRRAALRTFNPDFDGTPCVN